MYDFTKGVILTTSTIFFLQYLGSGIPKLRIYPLISFIIMAIFIFKLINKNINLTYKFPKPILVSSIFFSFCMAISSVLVNQVENSLLVFLDIIQYFIFPFILWHVINTPQKLTMLYVGIIILFLVAIICTLSEATFNTNYVTEFMKKYKLNAGILESWETERYGYKRCNSIFAEMTTLGFYSSNIFFISYFLKYTYSFPYRKILLIVLIFLPLCVFLTGARAAIVSFSLGVFILFFQKRFYNTSLFFTSILIFIFLFPYIINFLSPVIDGILHTDTVEGGSSSELRVGQLKTSIIYFNKSPIWGNGRNYISDVVMLRSLQIFGAEGIWFQIIVDYGIMGCIAFVMLVFSCIRELTSRNKFLIIFPISFLCSYTISTVIEVRYETLIVVSLLMIKTHTFYHSVYTNYKLNNIKIKPSYESNDKS